MQSASKVLHVAEDLNCFPDCVETLNLGRGDDTHHLECSEGKGKHDQVQDIDQDDVEEPAHYVVVRVEDVKHQDHNCHQKEHCETDKVADGVSPTHVRINHLECFVQFLGAHSSDHLP